MNKYNTSALNKKLSKRTFFVRKLKQKMTDVNQSNFSVTKIKFEVLKNTSRPTNQKNDKSLLIIFF